MNLSPMGPGMPTSSAMQGGEALSASLAKGAQKLEGQAALDLLAATAQVSVPQANPVGSTGSVIGGQINVTA